MIQKVIFLYFLIVTTIYANYFASSRPDIQSYIQHLVSEYEFDEDKLQNLFKTVTFNDEVIEKLEKPAEAKPWYQYKKIFLTDDLIEKGAIYWQQHECALVQAEKKYGVPASIIVAIIGVETKYGENKGTFPVFNTLATLAFNHKPRQDFFRSELTEFLLLARENNFAPLLLKGSYAGALGLPQFMPSSYRHYAVDFYHKGFADLFENHVDAIFSIANYLNKHGWKKGEPMVIAASVKDDSCVSLLQRKYKPSYTAMDLEKYNVAPLESLPSKCSFFRLENANGYAYWLGLQNFYVVSTYNNSELYIMAVRELAKEITKRRKCSQDVTLAEPDTYSLADQEPV